MENVYGDGGCSARPPKLRSSLGNVSPLSLNPHNFIGRAFCHRHKHHHLHTPIFAPYADSCSDSSNKNSPLIRYISSSSGNCPGGGVGAFLSSLPLFAIDNFDMADRQRPLPGFKASVKDEEDVIVMDEIAVDSSNSHASNSGAGARMRSSSSSMDQPSSSSSLPVSKENKAEEQEFVRGRPPRPPQSRQRKKEPPPSPFCSPKLLEPCKWFNSGKCTFGQKCRFGHNEANEALPSENLRPPNRFRGCLGFGVFFPDTISANNDVIGPSSSSEIAPPSMEAPMTSEDWPPLPARGGGGDPSIQPRGRWGHGSSATATTSAANNDDHGSSAKASTSAANNDVHGSNATASTSAENNDDHGSSAKASTSAANNDVHGSNATASTSAENNDDHGSNATASTSEENNDDHGSNATAATSAASNDDHGNRAHAAAANNDDHGNHAHAAAAAAANNHWSPLDDDIAVGPANEETPSREEVNVRIEDVLYRPHGRGRLPAFTEFCPLE